MLSTETAELMRRGDDAMREGRQAVAVFQALRNDMRDQIMHDAAWRNHTAEAKASGFASGGRHPAR